MVEAFSYSKKGDRGYICFYNRLLITRRWCHPDNSPSRNSKVWKKMPTRFNMDYENMSEKYHKIFEDQGL